MMPFRWYENEKTTTDYFEKESEVEYKYNEDENLAQIHQYILSTYDQHYSLNKFQAAEFIIDAGYGIEYCLGNILKYTQRYGRKGNEEAWRKDLMKIIHYAMIAMYAHDEEYSHNEEMTNG